MATVLIVSAVVMVATIAYSVYMMASMRTPGYGSSINGRTQVARTAIEPRRYVYGQVMLSGPMVFACSSGDKNKYIHMVITLTGHQVQEIGDIYLGDKLSTDPSYGLTTKEQGHWEYTYDVDGNIISETYVVDVPAGFRSLVTVRKYLGTADQQADAGLIAVSGGRWTSVRAPTSETNADLALLIRLASEGRLKPLVDRVYPLAQVPDAHRYVGNGRKRGNLAIKIRD